MDFRNLYDQGFARVAACTFPVALAEPATNATRILEQVRAAQDAGALVALFPELSLTGYSVGDLFLQDVLLDAVEAAILTVAQASAELTPVLVVGAPLRHGNRLYNCGVVIHGGQVVAVAPKSFLPTYREFYEARWFASGASCRGAMLHRPHWPGADEAGGIPFGPDLLVEVGSIPGLTLHVEVCEDMWVPVPPSHEAALAGASVLLNLSASPVTIGRAQDRELMARSASLRCNAAYVYAAAMAGESSTDLSWDGQTMVHELGTLLGAGQRFPEQACATIVDVDLEAIRQERMRQGSFEDNRVALGLGDDAGDQHGSGFRTMTIDLRPPGGDLGLRRKLDRFPFVPDDPAQLAQDCYEAYNIQVSALAQRLRSISGGDPERIPKVVIGVSGGLDSTHALIVAAKAIDRLRLPREHILAYTLPGFATSQRTRSNAELLCQGLGVSFETVDITALASQLLADLGHPYATGQEVYDVTFENVQAGVRTDFLFRAANHRGGIVLGTGDLSELALGWCTYGVGDHMSHYGVNAGVPKTLMQHLVRWVAASGQFADSPQVAGILESILGTEISPELIPTKDGEPVQSTQASIGPYALHDFTLFHLLRHGMAPSRIAFLAEHAWGDADAGHWPPGYPEGERPAYDPATIRHWLEVFLRRFFGNQFKRSAIPDGPKVTAGGALSPRGDWRMPSDASAAAWLAELEAVTGPRRAGR